MQNSIAWYSAAVTIGLLQASEQRCFTPSLQGIHLGHPGNQPFQGRGNIELLLEGVESFVGPSGAIKHPGLVCLPVWAEGLSASHQNPGQAFLNHPHHWCLGCSQQSLGSCHLANIFWGALGTQCPVRDQTISLPVEKGRNAFLFTKFPSTSRKWLGLNSSGVSHCVLSSSTEVSRGITVVPCSTTTLCFSMCGCSKLLALPIQPPNRSSLWAASANKLLSLKN